MKLLMKGVGCCKLKSKRMGSAILKRRSERCAVDAGSTSLSRALCPPPLPSDADV